MAAGRAAPSPLRGAMPSSQNKQGGHSLAPSLGMNAGLAWLPSAPERATHYHEASKGFAQCVDQPPISLKIPSRDLETVYGAVRHVLSCVEVCSVPAFKDSLWHWRTEMQRPQMVRALHMFAVLHECIRVLQDSRHYNGIVEIAKAMILIDFGKKAAKSAKSQAGKDKKDQRRKVKRPKPLAALIRLCATHIPSGFSWQADSQESVRPSWGGSGQNNTLVSLATFLFRWLALAASGHSRSEPHVYGNVLSLLVEIWEVADKPGILSRLDNSLDLLYGMDGTLAVWYERVGEALSEDALVERMFALGVLGMLMKRIAANHTGVAKDAIFSKLRSKHSVLEKQVLQKLKQTPARRHVAKVAKSRAESAPEESGAGGDGDSLPMIRAGGGSGDRTREPAGYSAHPGARSASADVGASGRDAILLALAPRFSGPGLPPNGRVRGGGEALRDNGSGSRPHQSLRDEQSEPVLRPAQLVPTGSSGTQRKLNAEAPFSLPGGGGGGGGTGSFTSSSRSSDQTTSPPSTPTLLARGPTQAEQANLRVSGLPHGKQGEAKGASENGSPARTLSRSQPDFVAAVNGHWGRGISRGLSFSFCSGVDSTSAEEESLGSLRPQLPLGQTPGTPSPATPRTGTSTGSRAVRVEPGRVPFSLAPAPSPHLPDISPAPSREGSEGGRAMLQSKMMMAEERNDGVRPYFPTKHMRSYAYRNKGCRRDQSSQPASSPTPVSDTTRGSPDKSARAPSHAAGGRVVEAPETKGGWDVDMLGGWEVEEEGPVSRNGLAAMDVAADPLFAM